MLEAKVGRLQQWFRSEGLDTAVVGLSGGIDSAVVLGLLLRAAAAADSPLRQVVAVSIPIAGSGATGQDEALTRARLVADRFGAELWVCPLGPVHDQLLRTVGGASGRTFDAWAAGQMLSVERTPVLYGAVALLRQSGAQAVVVGTTNRDEGAYLGFFGKASDAMVDVQPISDLHKSEVVALARVLGVPAAVLAVTPSGDVWDGRHDAEMIGVSYDDVELVLRLRELGRDPVAVSRHLADGDALRRADAAVEALHAVNAHKYRVGDPAVHLDVLPRTIPEGWHDQRPPTRVESPPIDLPGSWTAPDLALDGTDVPVASQSPHVLVADDVLSPDACRRLITALERAPSQPVGVTGVVGSHGTGSVRSTTFSEPLARELWRRIAPVAPAVRFLDDLDPSEGHRTPTRSGHRTWRLVGLSPLLRFMRYSRGGHHLCHHDAAYEYPDGRRTLMSVVLFLTGDGTCERGGALRFVDDGQQHLPVWDRSHDDWSTETPVHAVVESVFPRAGRVAIFDHLRCHDVQRWDGDDPRIVIRGDLVFEPVADGRGLG